MKNRNVHISTTNSGSSQSVPKPLATHSNPAAGGQQREQGTAPVNGSLNKNNVPATPKTGQNNTNTTAQSQKAGKKNNKAPICRCSKAGDKCASGVTCKYPQGSSKANPKSKTNSATAGPQPSRKADPANRQAEERKRAAQEAEAAQALLKAQREQDERQIKLLELMAKAKERREKEEKEAVTRAEQEAMTREKEPEKNDNKQTIVACDESKTETPITVNLKGKGKLVAAAPEPSKAGQDSKAARAQHEQDERQAELLRLVEKAKERRDEELKAIRLQREQDERQEQLMRLVEQAKERKAAEEKELAAEREREREREAEVARIREELLAAEREKQEKEQLAREAEAARNLEEFLAAERERVRREAEAAAAERQRLEVERLAREAEAARIREAFLAAERERLEQERLAREAEREAARLARLARKEAARKAREAELEARRVEIAKQEAAFTTKHIVLGSTLVTCGAGIDIRHVVSGFESCRITVKNLPFSAKLPEIAELFTQQGIEPDEFLILGTRPVDGKYLEAKILANAEKANAIAIGLDGIDFRNKTLSFEVTENASADAMGESSARNPETLTVSWRAPSASMVATYDSMDAARAKAQTLDRTVWRGRRIRAEMNRPPTGPALRYYSPSSIKITGIHPDVTSLDILDVTGPAAVKTIKSCLYDLPEAYRVLERHVRATPNDGVASFEVKSQFNGGVDGNISVQIRFETWEQAKVARDSLDGTRLRPDYPPFRVSLPNPLQFVSTIPIQQYRAQRGQWDSLAGNNGGGKCHLRTNIYENERVAIRVVGDDKKAVGSLKVRVETLVAGERLDAAHWHRSFNTPKGRQFLAKVSTDTGVYVRSDWKVNALKIHGGDEAKQEARQLILAEIERLSLLEWTVPLKRQSVGYFVRKGLAALQEILGEDSVSLDLTPAPGRITIKGGEEARHHLTVMLDESLKDNVAIPNHEDTADICPICYDTVSHPVQLGCGHKYCTACIRHYLTSASDTKAFPLACMGNEAQCRVSIAIQLIQRFLTPQNFDQLVNVAFSTYIDLHPQDFRYCTTPDCVQIYRCNSGASQKCPSCFAAVCSDCHEEAHEGMTCAERALHKNPAEQERLNENWAAQNGVKKCPSCKVWIEKTEGCNHMTCKCGAHICWKCMGIFTAGTIYDHLNDEHGGAFEHEAVDHGAFARQQVFQAYQHPQAVLGEAANINRFDEERRNEERRNRLLLQQRAEARQLEEFRRVQLEAQQQRLRAERQRQADLAAAAERRRIEQNYLTIRAETERRQQLARQQAAQREKDSSWCIVM